MTDRQIKCFLTLCRTLSFTETAKELYISQPAISKMVSSLEEELGIQLFDRYHKSVTLTKAGVVLCQFFLKAEKEFLEVHREARNLHHGLLGSINVGILNSLKLSKEIGHLSHVFAEKYPEISYSFEWNDFEDLISRLERRNIDIAVSIDLLFKSQVRHDLIIHPIGTTAVRFFYSASHRLANKQNLSISDFSDEPILTIQHASKIPVKEVIRDICKPYGFEPKFLTVPNNISFQSMIENGLGVGFTDELSANPYNKKVKNIKTKYRHTIAAAWLKDSTNPCIQVFVDDALPTLFDKLKW